MDNQDLMHYNRNRIQTEIFLVKNPTKTEISLVNIGWTIISWSWSISEKVDECIAVYDT